MSHSALTLSGVLACAALAACEVPLKFAPPAPSSQSSSQETIADIITPQDELVEPGDVSTAQPLTGSAAVLSERLLPGGILEIGNREATNTLLLFTNHSCAYCRDFHERLMPTVIEDYVRKDTLKLHVVPFDIARYRESAQTATMLLCASAQGKGASMNDLLFTQNLPQTQLAQQINAMGIDAAALQTCLTSAQTEQSRSTLASFARSLGIDVVPAYFINGEKYVGLPEEADLRGQMEEALR